MPTGKPDFNLNSYGVKYLSKEEVQEFLQKRQGESIRSVGETKTKPLGVSGKPYAGVERERTSTSGLKQGEYKPSLEGRKQIDATINTPKQEIEKPAKPTNLTISAPNAAGDEELQGGTRSVFNSPTYGSKQIKPKTEKPKKEHLGSNVGEKNTDKIQSVDVKGNKRSIENISEIKEGEERSKPTGSGSESKIGIKKPSKLGDAPANVKGKESKVGQKKVRVGVGEKAHEELERRDGVGEKRYAADPKSPYSKRTERREQKEQAQARKLGIAQSKLQEAKRRKQIEALGTAKKSNDIITEMNIMKLNLMKKDDPCWEGYEAIGMKDKDGKQVPNCVKKAEEEKKPLNKPMRDDGNKKFKVYVRDPSTGNIVTVRFGDPNMEIKRDSPERRSSFRARHKCSEQKDITSAAYWSCKMWEKTSSVSDNIGKSADETIFKAISLKLDLTKSLK
jgi:hypothetical protein